MIKHENGKFVVKDASGKRTLKSFPNMELAKAYLASIKEKRTEPKTGKGKTSKESHDGDDHIDFDFKG